MMSEVMISPLLAVSKSSAVVPTGHTDSSCQKKHSSSKHSGMMPKSRREGMRVSAPPDRFK